MTKEERPLRRAAYFARAALDLALPAGIARRRVRRILQRARAGDLPDELRDRLDYCNMLAPLDPPPPPPARRVRDYRVRDKTFYAIDLLRHARGFGADTPLAARFGDHKTVPDTPMLVKARPSHGPRANAVLFPLDTLRHFQIFPDPVPFAEKLPHAAWRGRPHNPVRRALAERFHDHPRHDIGLYGSGPFARPWISGAEQNRYRYLLAPEGNDVASNLCRILSSNSLAVAPPMTCETWLMQGRLVPGVHFVQVADDFSDLDETIAHYEAHPGEAREIVANANAWAARFADPAREATLAVLVLAKYLECSGLAPKDLPRVFT